MPFFAFFILFQNIRTYSKPKGYMERFFPPIRKEKIAPRIVGNLIL